MKLLDIVIKEYISIVEFLLTTETLENERIIIDREQFKSLLEKYAYMDFRQKKNIYKAVNFIVHEKNNYTMPVKDVKTKKTIRKVVINYKTYEVVKRLYKEEIIV